MDINYGNRVLVINQPGSACLLARVSETLLSFVICYKLRNDSKTAANANGLYAKWFMIATVCGYLK